MGGRGKRTKQMVRVRYLFAALAAIIVSTTAHAADMPLPAPQIVYQQPVCCDTGRWYLRGDVGVGVQTFSAFNHSQTNSAFVWPPSWTIVQQDIQDTAIFGMGIGYAWLAAVRCDRRISQLVSRRLGAIPISVAARPVSTSTPATSRRRYSWATPMSI
jgi:hypothetical protein